jgi:hypothetical protein
MTTKEACVICGSRLNCSIRARNCKKYKQIYDEDYRNKNRMHKRKNDRLYYQQNKKAKSAQGKEYRIKNKDHIAARRKTYYALDKNRVKKAQYDFKRHHGKEVSKEILAIVGLLALLRKYKTHAKE